MAISERDRKLLWANAGGCCAVCKLHLTSPASGLDRAVVLGVEAHIVSNKLRGPRYRPMPSDDVDAYPNRILLCASDHSLVDQQLDTYSEERLLELKVSHERWVLERGKHVLPRISMRDVEGSKPLLLRRMDTGQQLMKLVGGSAMAYHDHPEAESDEEAGVLGDFLQNLNDYMDIWSEMGPAGQVRAELSVRNELNSLMKSGFVVYAAVRRKIMEGGVGPPLQWPVTYVVIKRLEDAYTSGDDSSATANATNPS